MSHVKLRNHSGTSRTKTGQGGPNGLANVVSTDGQTRWRPEEPSTNAFRYSMELCAREAREERWDSCGGS